MASLSTRCRVSCAGSKGAPKVSTSNADRERVRHGKNGSATHGMAHQQRRRAVRRAASRGPPRGRVSLELKSMLPKSPPLPPRPVK